MVEILAYIAMLALGAVIGVFFTPRKGDEDGNQDEYIEELERKVGNLEFEIIRGRLVSANYDTLKRNYEFRESRIEFLETRVRELEQQNQDHVVNVRIVE